MELGSLCHDVDGLMRKHANMNAHVAALLGLHVHAVCRAGPVRLDDVRRLRGDGVARDADGAAVDCGDLDGPDAAGEDGAEQDDEHDDQGDGDADLDGIEVVLERHEGARLRRPRTDPRERKRDDAEKAGQPEDEHAEALEPTHAFSSCRPRSACVETLTVRGYPSAGTSIGTVDEERGAARIRKARRRAKPTYESGGPEGPPQRQTSVGRADYSSSASSASATSSETDMEV